MFSPVDGPLRHDLQALGLTVELFRQPSKTREDRHDLDSAALARRLADAGIDCVFANTLFEFSAVIAAAGAGIPSIWAIHESFSLPVWSSAYADWRPARAFIRRRLETALERASAVTFVAEATRRLYLGHARAERFLRIPFGIDVAAIERYRATRERAAARSRLGIAADSFVLLCIGNFEARKQQILLTQAFAEISGRHPHAVLVLVGELPSFYSAILRQYIQQQRLGSTIRFDSRHTGNIPLVRARRCLRAVVRCRIHAARSHGSDGIRPSGSGNVGVWHPGADRERRAGLLIQPNSLRSAIDGLEKLIGLSATERQAMAIAASKTIASDHDSRSYATAYAALIRRIVP